jgi:hypothetical protein
LCSGSLLLLLGQLLQLPLFLLFFCQPFVLLRYPEKCKISLDFLRSENAEPILGRDSIFYRNQQQEILDVKAIFIDHRKSSRHDGHQGSLTSLWPLIQTLPITVFLGCILRPELIVFLIRYLKGTVA